MTATVTNPRSNFTPVPKKSSRVTPQPSKRDKAQTVPRAFERLLLALLELFFLLCLEARFLLGLRLHGAVGRFGLPAREPVGFVVVSGHCVAADIAATLTSMGRAA